MKSSYIPNRRLTTILKRWLVTLSYAITLSIALLAVSFLLHTAITFGHHADRIQVQTEFNEVFLSYEHLASAVNASWDIFNHTLSIAPTSGGAHREPSFAQNSHGSFVAWSDLRNNVGDGNWDVYLQRTDENGNRLWEFDLLVNSDATTHNQSKPTVNIDSNGNGVVVWQDYRGPSGAVYAQKISPDRTKLWGNDVQVNETGTYLFGWGDFMIRIVASVIDADDNVYVVWQGNRDGKWDSDIFLQKIGPNGQRVWDRSVRVNDDLGNAQQFPAIEIADSGELSIAWIDDRNGGQDVYLQRVSKDGQRLWNADKRINQDSGTALQGNISLVINRLQETYVIWRTGPILPPINEKENEILLQKVDVNGQNLWPSSRRVNQDNTHAYRGYPVTSLTPSGSVVVMWKDDRNGYGKNDVFVQLLDSNGTRQWDTDFQISPAGWDDQWTGEIHMADGQATTVWMKRDDVYYQRVDLGTRQLTLPYPAMVNEADGELAHKYPDVSIMSKERAFFVWHSYIHGRWTVYANILNADGVPLWPQNSMVSDFEHGQPAWNVRGRPRVDTNADDQSLVVWVDEREGIWGQLVDVAGNQLWQGAQRINLRDQKVYFPSVATLNDGTFVVAWLGLRENGSNIWDIYIQHIDVDGSRIWPADVRVNLGDYRIDELDLRSRPELAVDNEGNVVVAWRGEVDGTVDVFVHKFGVDGNSIWNSEIPLESNLSNWTWYGGESMIAVAAKDRIGVGWISSGNGGFGVSVQSLSPDGQVLWPSPQWISGAPYIAYYGNPNLSFKNDGSLLAVWDDEHASRRIYAQLLGTNGVPLWPEPYVINDTWPLHPTLSAYSGDNVWITWVDERDSNERIYVQKATEMGAVTWPDDVVLTPPGANYYHESGQVVSQIVDQIPQNISHTMLTVEEDLNGGKITYFVSNNNGESWEVASPGERHFFLGSGSDLRWKAVLESGNGGLSSPRIHYLRLQYNPDMSGDLTISSPTLIPGQSVLFLASIRSADRPMPNLDNVLVTTGDTQISLTDNGMGPDMLAGDGLYTGDASYEILNGHTEVELVVGSNVLDTIAVNYTTNPLTLVITDWGALFQEFRDTGMGISEDINENGTHDFFDLMDRLRIYAQEHQGTIVDPSSYITVANGFGADFRQLPYTGGTDIRYEKGLLIDELIARVCDNDVQRCTNIAIVGDDEVVPFYRVFDPTDYFGLFYPDNPDFRSRERNYPDSVNGAQGNPALMDMQEAYILSDVPYSIRSQQIISPTLWVSRPPLWAKRPTPNMGIGRIFSMRPMKLVNAVNQYEKPIFLTSGHAAASVFAAEGDSPSYGKLVDRSVMPDAEDWFGANLTLYDRSDRNWSAFDFSSNVMTKQLVTMWGHANHRSFQIAGGESIVAEDLEALVAITSKLVVGYGCHLGLTVANSPNGGGIVPQFSRALANRFIENGITYFAPISEAYTWESRFQSASVHERMVSLFLNQLMNATNPTIGDVWMQVYPKYHSTDPAFIETDNEGVHLFHIAGAYGMVLYGLPTQPIDRVSTNQVETLYSSVSSRHAAPQSSISLNVQVPNFLVAEQMDGTSLFAIPNGGTYLAPTNGPALPIALRSVTLPSNFLVTDVRLVSSESEIYGQPVTLAKFSTVSANGASVAGQFRPSSIYPEHLFAYSTRSTSEGTLLTVTAVPFQYDTVSQQVTLYTLLEFAVDGIFSSPSLGPQVEYVTVNQGLPLRINQSGQKVTVEIASTQFDNVHFNWVISDQSGNVVDSGRAPIHVIDGTTTVRFAVDTYDWLPGTKDLAIFIQKAGEVVSSRNSELLVEGIHIYSLGEPTVTNQSGEWKVVWEVNVLDENGDTSSGLEPNFEVSVNGNPAAAEITELGHGRYEVQLPGAALSHGPNHIRISVVDSRGIISWRTWRTYNSNGDVLFLPVIARP